MTEICLPRPHSLIPTNPKLTSRKFRTTPADRKHNLAMRTVRLALQIAMIAIRFINIRPGFTGIIGELILPVHSLKIFIADIAVRIKTEFTFPGQGVAAPVQVRHAGIPVLMSREQKMIAAMISSDTAAEDLPRQGFGSTPNPPYILVHFRTCEKYSSRVFDLSQSDRSSDLEEEKNAGAFFDCQLTRNFGTPKPMIQNPPSFHSGILQPVRP